MRKLEEVLVAAARVEIKNPMTNRSVLLALSLLSTASAFSPTALTRPSPARNALSSSAPLLARTPPPRMDGNPLGGMVSTLLIGGLAYGVISLVGIENLMDVGVLGNKDRQFPDPNAPGGMYYDEYGNPRQQYDEYGQQYYGQPPQQQEEGMGLDEVVKLGGIGFCVVALLVLNVGVL